MPALDQAEAQAIHVSIRPEEFIKDESGDIEGTISDSVYLGLNTEYFIETGFASKIQLAKNQLLKKIFKRGSNSSTNQYSKVKCLFCRWSPKSYYRSWL